VNPIHENTNQGDGSNYDPNVFPSNYDQQTNVLQGYDDPSQFIAPKGNSI
jgi:hypothetical protein